MFLLQFSDYPNISASNELASTKNLVCASN